VKSNIAFKLMSTTAAIVGIAFVPDTKACNLSRVAGPFLASRILAPAPVLESAVDLAMSPTARLERQELRDGQPEVIGMWLVNLYDGTTGQLLDRAIQQFYGDGNEMMNSSAFPPATENVCFGVWRATGPGAFKLRHIGWNFDANGSFLGSVRLSATITVDRRGDTYVGSFVYDVLDPSGNLVPGSTILGTLKGNRFKPD